MFKKLTFPLIAALAFAGNAFAADYTGRFEKRAKPISGTWTLAEVDGKQVIRFNNDFKTKKGPDLKIFLSKKTVANLKKKPTFIAPVRLGPIDGIKGAQEYVVPDDINLDDFESILIHCEKFNILWGGFDIPEKSAASTDTPKDSYESSFGS